MYKILLIIFATILWDQYITCTYNNLVNRRTTCIFCGGRYKFCVCSHMWHVNLLCIGAIGAGRRPEARRRRRDEHSRRASAQWIRFLYSLGSESVDDEQQAPPNDEGSDQLENDFGEFPWNWNICHCGKRLASAEIHMTQLQVNFYEFQHISAVDERT